ncbi:MAG: HPr-rel-A system PqqD family peptide chaperone [Gammaproteobacteria bacterium]|nr:HPr-rel-A system PqqD family peptide chaperone [Gammaproteobacteria bacterium]
MEVSQQAQSTTSWKILEEGALHWEKWGEQYALYDSLSGETHLLPEFSARVLQQLSVRPRTADALARALCEGSDETCEQTSVEHVSQLLEQLQAAGLTEKVQF